MVDQGSYTEVNGGAFWKGVFYSLLATGAADQKYKKQNAKICDRRAASLLAQAPLLSLEPPAPPGQTGGHHQWLEEG